MFDAGLLFGYNLVVGVATGAGLLYFLGFESRELEYHLSLQITAAGVALFALGGPTTELLAPSLTHWVHALAAFLVVAGLWERVGDRDGRFESDILLADAGSVRRTARWATPADEAILELFDSTRLVFTPAVAAFNLGYSREEVNRRLSTLETRGFVERVERGKYRISDRGERYVRGGLPDSSAMGGAGSGR